MPSSLTDHSEYASIPYTPAPSNNLKESHKEASSAASYSPLPLMISHCPLNPPSTSHCMQKTSSSTLPALTLHPLNDAFSLPLPIALNGPPHMASPFPPQSPPSSSSLAPGPDQTPSNPLPPSFFTAPLSQSEPHTVF